ncbi:hypothetical protein D3C81_114730 [compost metagenome]|nr:hypothetical protein SOD10_02780 [Serratia plymuthica]CAI0827671.1 Uncharacterised protein [Serratia plymuthica]
MESCRHMKLGQFLSGFAGVLQKNFFEEGKTTEAEAPVDIFSNAENYMCLTIASPNSEHFSSLAPSIRRSKS